MTCRWTRLGLVTYTRLELPSNLSLPDKLWTFLLLSRLVPCWWLVYLYLYVSRSQSSLVGDNRLRSTFLDSSLTSSWCKTCDQWRLLWSELLRSDRGSSSTEHRSLMARHIGPHTQNSDSRAKTCRSISRLAFSCAALIRVIESKVSRCQSSLLARFHEDPGQEAIDCWLCEAGSWTRHLKQKLSS